MAETLSRSALVRSPPDDINVVHRLIEDFWTQSPDIEFEDRIRFETALIELASNVLRYSGSDSVDAAGVECEVVIEASTRSISASLVDSGPAKKFNLDKRGMPDELSESGRGIPLIQALVDEVEYRRNGELNCWTITRNLLRPEQTASFPDIHAPAAEPTVSERRTILGGISEATRLRGLGVLPIIDLVPEERFDRVTRLAQQLFGVQSAAVTLLDSNRQRFKSRVGVDDIDIPRTDSIFSASGDMSQTLVVHDAAEDPRFANNRFVVGEPHMRFYAGHPLQGPGGELLGTFCIFDPSPREFNDAERGMLVDLAHWAQHELSVDLEFARAAHVQRGLLPKQLISLPGFQVAGDCLPARAVGGDFYDWFPVGEGAAFTLADVMGKGIGAAIIAASVRAVIRAGARRNEIDSAVQAAASILEADLDEIGTFVTMFHARLNMDTGVVRYIDAGHGLTILVHADGGSDRLRTTSLPLGASIDETWEEHRAVLEPGDSLVSVSDGVLDLFDGTLASLGEVEKIVRSTQSAQAAVDTLIALASSDSAPDDVTIVVIRRES